MLSIHKYFEPYLAAEGHYHIEHTKNWVRKIHVDETMLNLSLYGGQIEPVSLKDHLKAATKIVKLTGDGRYKIEKKARIVYDQNWREVGFDELPFVPFEEQPGTVLGAVDKKYEITLLKTEKEIELLKSKLVSRPEDINCIHDELFNVSERAIIYKPMYSVVVNNLKKKQKATLTIDAITGETKSYIHKSSVPTKKEEPDTKKPATPSVAKKKIQLRPKSLKKEKNQVK